MSRAESPVQGNDLAQFYLQCKVDDTDRFVVLPVAPCVAANGHATRTGTDQRPPLGPAPTDAAGGCGNVPWLDISPPVAVEFPRSTVPNGVFTTPR